MYDDDDDEFYFIYSWSYHRWEGIHYSLEPYEPDEHWFLPSNVEILPRHD